MKKNNLTKFAVLLWRLGKLLFVNPRGLKEVCGVALGVTEGVMDADIDVLPIPSINTIDLVEDTEGQAWNIIIRPFPRITFSIILEEATGLGFLMQKCRAKRAFEFGTHRGVSSTQLAANFSPWICLATTHGTISR
jgi:hypothetical protein